MPRSQSRFTSWSGWAPLISVFWATIRAVASFSTPPADTTFSVRRRLAGASLLWNRHLWVPSPSTRTSVHISCHVTASSAEEEPPWSRHTLGFDWAITVSLLNRDRVRPSHRRSMIPRSYKDFTRDSRSIVGA